MPDPRRVALVLGSGGARGYAHIGAVQVLEERGPDAEAGIMPAGLSRFDVMNQSLEAMQTLVAGYRLAGFPPDVLITVPKDTCRTLDFHRAEAMIAVGREVTEAALDAAGIASSPGDGALDG